jgi:predicted ribosome quality control (RQC) complex YloA/Tae2 family protein
MQQRRRTALEEQLATAATPGQCAETAGQELAEDADKAAKLRAKAERRAQQVPQHLAEVAAKETRLDALLGQLATRGADLALVRSEMEAMGLQERLKTFDLNKAAHDQRGRPDGFTGLVLESPRGVPILVGPRTFADPLLRRVGRGTDLWFQVAEGKGSRVLLRTSMARHLTKSSRECMEMAADLAAHFSDSRPRGWDAEATVEVMYTDSRHVAKRGTRVGQMKDSKKLGTIWAKPARVANAAREAQEEQGWM